MLWQWSNLQSTQLSSDLVEYLHLREALLGWLLEFAFTRNPSNLSLPASKNTLLFLLSFQLETDTERRHLALFTLPESCQQRHWGDGASSWEENRMDTLPAEWSVLALALTLPYVW